MSIEHLTLEEENITIRGKALKIVRPSHLEEIFRGDPLLESEAFPFWFKIWESSLILADYLFNIEPVKEILEIGAGLGVVSLFASALGHKVVATDCDDLPLELIKISASINGLTLQTQKLNWLEAHLEQKFDLIVGAEVIYKRIYYKPLLELFRKGLKEGGEVLLAHSMDRKRILIPFLYQAESFFEVKTSIRKITDSNECIEIILNKLSPKDES
ncbi:MAG: protein N-lysine methyltransferase family protein [Caldimicrobium sp.]|nr:protein N-lysine methyltransferase family protein [Caldimicrobium sp.]MCX7873733.1 protein N-lysine methyltransferase family protein [Caldimicrobium sp.]MDW8093657.1 50S ribosomal protein L11 methyltransferase [Caldimicrobium sp.]